MGVLLFMVLGLGGVSPHKAHAQTGDASTVFSHGLTGLGVGAHLGLATGYLIARNDGWRSSDWRTLGFGVGIGALIGAGAGVGLGIAESARPESPFAYRLLRNTATGATFGTAVGAVAGAVAWLSSDKGEHVLLGAAIGTLVGAGAGLVLTAVQKPPAARGSELSGRNWLVTMSAASDISGSLCALPAVAGRY